MPFRLFFLSPTLSIHIYLTAKDSEKHTHTHTHEESIEMVSLCTDYLSSQSIEGFSL